MNAKSILSSRTFYVNLVAMLLPFLFKTFTGHDFPIDLSTYAAGLGGSNIALRVVTSKPVTVPLLKRA